ncbi:MAG TPA: P-type conjugative transfer protein TrbL, partial [Nitrosospira sp.]
MRCLLLALLAACSMPVLAAADLHDATRSFDGLLGLIKQNSSAWNGVLRGYAINVFWSLASIQCVMTFYPYLFKQPDFGELFAEIVRFMLVIGFFFALLLHSAEWGEAIVNSFRQAGAAAAGTGTHLRPGEMFGMGVELAKMVGNVETWNPVEAVMIAIATVIILISFVFIAAFMQVTLIESYIVINA